MLSPSKPTILVVDDTPANLTLMSGLLQDEYKVKVAINGEKALKIAFSETPPDLILLDIMMPEMDGYEVCKRLKVDTQTQQIPVIFLTAKVEVEDEERGLSLGAVDYITKPISPSIALARIKTHLTLHLQKQEIIDSQKQLAQEINEAAEYIRSLLPLPLNGAVQTAWQHIPSSSLGGDAFGHHWIDDDHFAVYLLDVCGHGVGAALLCISAMNAIRSQSLKNCDFTRPSDVLKALNEAFPMEEQNNKYFTIWYGVYQSAKNVLSFSSGGHPHAILFSGDTAADVQLKKLSTGNMAIGCMPAVDFVETQISLNSYNKLYVFSDGVYEVKHKDGYEMSLNDFSKLMLDFNDVKSLEAEAILQAIRAAKADDGAFDDDFSLLEIMMNQARSL